MSTLIQRVTASYFKITIDQLINGAKVPSVVTARHVARYLERTLSNRSFENIAADYNCHHTSVMASANHMTDRLAAGDNRYVQPVADIKALVKAQDEVDQRDKKTQSVVYEQMACPTCGAPVIKELRRQLVAMRAEIEELKRGRAQ